MATRLPNEARAIIVLRSERPPTWFGTGIAAADVLWPTYLLGLIAFVCRGTSRSMAGADGRATPHEFVRGEDIGPEKSLPCATSVPESGAPPTIGPSERRGKAGRPPLAPYTIFGVRRTEVTAAEQADLEAAAGAVASAARVLGDVAEHRNWKPAQGSPAEAEAAEAIEHGLSTVLLPAMWRAVVEF